MDDPNNQRSGARVTVDYAIEFLVPGVPGFESDGSARVLDLSETGLRFVSRQPLEPGTDVTVRLPPLREGMPRLTRLASVVRCMPADDGDGFAIGCAYD